MLVKFIVKVLSIESEALAIESTDRYTTQLLSWRSDPLNQYSTLVCWVGPAVKMNAVQGK